MMRLHSRSWISSLLLFALVASAGAQEAEPESKSTGSAAVVPEPHAVERGREQLEQAYRKEYAFLEAQRRDLRRQLEALDSDYEQEAESLESDIQRLERQVLELGNRAEELRELVNQAERDAQLNAEASEVLATTFSQAAATLGEHGRDVTQSDAFQGASDEQRVALLFDEALALLADLSRVRIEPGAFFLPDGTQVEGDIVRVGNIASFGVSGQGAGALAPAGEGKLKIWADSDANGARELAAGGMPDPLNAFVYESTTTAVTERTGEGIVNYINDGGVIAWIIVGLGFLVTILIVARAAFLRWASSSTGRLQEEVGALVRRGRVDDALALCERESGATARVMAAAVRNLERDREHVEDIVSEAILHENAHLNRFGAFILVIAAVSPLLGLLGTVTGMISTFEVITEFGTGDPRLLSGGISIALITTELGLMVAIPALLLGNLLSGWAERIKTGMEQAALKVINQHQEVQFHEHREAA